MKRVDSSRCVGFNEVGTTSPPDGRSTASTSVDRPAGPIAQTAHQLARAASECAGRNSAEGQLQGGRGPAIGQAVATE